MLVLLVLAYVLIPGLRQRIGWAVMTLAVVVPVAVFFARWSGQIFADSDAFSTARPPLLPDHRMFGDWLLWLTIGLAPVTFLFGLLERGRRSALARATGASPVPRKDEDGNDVAAPPRPNDDPAAGGRKLVMIILGMLMIVTAAACAYVVFKSGHTGASMVWRQGS